MWNGASGDQILLTKFYTPEPLAFTISTWTQSESTLNIKQKCYHIYRRYNCLGQTETASIIVQARWAPSTLGYNKAASHKPVFLLQEAEHSQGNTARGSQDVGKGMSAWDASNLQKATNKLKSRQEASVGVTEEPWRIQSMAHVLWVINFFYEV